MSSTNCKYEGNREEALVAYLYDEIGSADCERFEVHLASCELCRRELAGFRSSRTQLAGWTPPHFESAVSRLQSSEDGRQSSNISDQPSADHRRWWQEVPAWAQVAAALLCVGVSAGLANLNVHYDSGGLTVRTGWSPARAVATTDAAIPSAVARSAVAGPTVQPWQVDLARLESRLRSELAAAQTSAVPAPGLNEAELMRRVRAAVDESERKEERELALRVAEISRDVQAQRQADLTKIEHNLGMIQNNTGFEVMRQRELLNSLAVRVSQTR